METACLFAAIAALSAAVARLYRRNEQLHNKIERHLSTTIWFLLKTSRRDAEAQRDSEGEEDGTHT